MELRNVSKKAINMKLPDNSWKTLRPGESADLPEKFQRVKGLELTKEKPKKKDELDLNNDGVVDAKDKSIAGKVLSFGRKKSKKKKSKE